MSKFNYKLLLSIFLIFTLIVNPIFANHEPGHGNYEEPENDESDDGDWFGIKDALTEFFSAPLIGMVNYYNGLLETFQDNFNPLQGDDTTMRETLGQLYLSFYEILFYIMVIWIYYMQMTSFLGATSDEAYANRREMWKAFFRTLGAIIISGLVGLIAVKLLVTFVNIFSTTGLTIDTSSDSIGALNIILGPFLMIVLIGLTLIGLIISFLASIFMAFGMFFISLSFIAKNSYGGAQTIGNYMFFFSLYMMGLPIAFTAPSFFLSYLFGGFDADVNSQITRAIVGMALGVVASIAYIKMAKTMYIMRRVGAAFSLLRMTKKSIDQNSKSKKKGSKEKEKSFSEKVGEGAAKVTGGAVATYAAVKSPVHTLQVTNQQKGTGAIYRNVQSFKTNVSKSYNDTLGKMIGDGSKPLRKTGMPKGMKAYMDSNKNLGKNIPKAKKDQKLEDYIKTVKGDGGPAM